MTLIKDGLFIVSCPLGGVLVFLCFLFWRLDQRNRVLVSNGENALRFLDASNRELTYDGKPHVLCIFEIDDFNTKGQSRSILRSGHFSYSQVISYVYLVFALIGILFACFPVVRGVLGAKAETSKTQYISGDWDAGSFPGCIIE